MKKENQKHFPINILKKVKPFQELTPTQLEIVSGHLKQIQLKQNQILFSEADKGRDSFVVVSGRLSFTKMGRTIKHFAAGDFFGEIAMLDEKSRMGRVVAEEKSELLVLSHDNLMLIHKEDADAAAKIYKGFAQMVISYLREEVALYDKIDVLLIQDGGCAPGYNSVTAFLTEYLEKNGFEVFIADQGFRSLVSDNTEDYRYLVYDGGKYAEMEHLAGVVFAPPLREERGANFRSERFPEFKDTETQKEAAENLKKRNVRIIIGIGGNGTFAGIKNLSKYMKNTRVFFIPVTIDSDIYGTECIGQHTGVEAGAEKIHRYMADGRTHDRIYIIEMMGAEGGYHALHSCLGAGAHLAVLPRVKYNIKKIATNLNNKNSAVIVVAEGYEKEKRDKEKCGDNAAVYFKDLLIKNGLDTERKIICEPFARDIRGTEPNNMDVSLAQRMSHNLVELIKSGRNKVMPATLSGQDYAIEFKDIKTDNTVAAQSAHLANRLT